MALESGTWVEDLVVTNPPGTDQKSQGDDHLRLIKSVLKNSFKRTSGRAISFPTLVAKSAGGYVLSVTDDGTIFRCDTSAGFVTFVLPTVSSVNAGWKISISKGSTDSNPVYAVPPSGTINGYSQIQRSKRFEITEVMWNGVEYVASRPSGMIVGQVIDYFGATLPPGFLWCDGATFSATFVELASVLGTTATPDLRGRSAVGRDNQGGVGIAGRVTLGGSGIDGNTLKAAGGTETHVLTTAQLAAHLHDITHGHGGTTGGPNSTHSHTISGTTDFEAAHTHTYPDAGISGAPLVGSGASFGTPNVDTTRTTSAGSPHLHTLSSAIVGVDSPAHTHTFTNTTSQSPTNSGLQGSGAAHLNMQPSIICNKIIVAE